MKSITRKRMDSAEANGTRLGRKPKDKSEKRTNWSRRMHPRIQEMISALSKHDLMSDTGLVEHLVNQYHQKVFPSAPKLVL